MRFYIALKRRATPTSSEVVILDPDVDERETTEFQLVLLAANCDAGRYEAIIRGNDLIAHPLPADAGIDPGLFPEIPEGKSGVAFKEYDIVFGCSKADEIIGFRRQLQMALSVLT